jgi:hypothetical protein
LSRQENQVSAKAACLLERQVAGDLALLFALMQKVTTLPFEQARKSRHQRRLLPQSIIDSSGL